MRAALLLPALFGIANAAFAQPAPTMLTLPTGSEVATWTIHSELPKHKTPIVFLHGGPGLYTEERRIEEGAVFRAAGFSTIYFDQIGGGKSKRLAATSYTIDRAVNDLEGLRVKLGQDKLVLWGNSWGVTLATLYANQYPNRVAALILTSPGTFPGTSAKRNYAVTNRDKVVLGKDITRAAAEIDKKGAAAETVISQEQAGKAFDEVVATELIEAMVCKSAKVTPPTLPGGANLYANRLMLKQLDKLSFKPAPQPQRPVLILRGTCDYLVPENSAKYATLFGVPVTPVAATGHGMLENRTVVEKALADFANGPLSIVE
jgi:pimeloyl-ACP methyl ester carboxylesterase